MLTITIVTHNAARYIQRCLKSIPNYPIILIDNASTDPTIKEVMKSSSKNLTVIKNKKNIGYGSAANQAQKLATTKYLLLINPDIILNQKAIEEMIRYMESHPQCDVQGPKLIDEKKHLLYSCRAFPTIKALIGVRTGLFKKEVNAFLMKSFDHKTVKKVDWVSGGCIMYRNTKKNSFDERFFLYFEDVDFCHGKSVFYNPKAVIIHTTQRTSAHNPSHFLMHCSSWIKYFLKWS